MQGEAAQLGVPGKPGQYGLRRKQLCLFLLEVDLQHSRQGLKALFNPETSIFIQKCRPYTKNLNSETSGASSNAFLGCGDV